MLPIFEIQAQLNAALSAARPPNLLLKAPTGSGKSTQVPQMVLDAGVIPPGQRIVVMQPRRIAARMLAARVAQERGSRLGQEVGYQVRFDNITSKETRIVFATEGVLLRQLISDPELRQVGCLIIDEFHERHLDGDLCLAWARQLQRSSRPDLRLIVMSATLAPETLEDFLFPTLTLESEGRTFPVEVRYQSPKPSRGNFPEPIWEQAARACQSLAQEAAGAGNLLVFMPGAYEIQKTLTALKAHPISRSHNLVPMHGELPPEQQDAALAPGGRPKIIVSTNVAETSLTIEGVTAVIDSGLARIASYDVRRGLNTLMVQKISRASAEQRAGRAGRLGPGIAIRLWPEREHSHREEAQVPEVRRLDLAEACLTLKQASASLPPAAGESHGWIDWFEPPPEAAVTRAESLLTGLGALDSRGHISALGQRMARFPSHPRFSRLLLAAGEEGCLTEAAGCAALAQGRGILLKKGGAAGADFWEPGDVSEFQAHLRALRLAEQFRFDPQRCGDYGIHARASREAAASQEQFLRLAQRQGLPISEEPAAPQALARALLAGFSDHLGSETSRGSRIYQMAGGFSGLLASDAHIKPPPLLVAAEVTEVQGKALQVHLNLVTRIELDDLQALFPDDFSSGQSARYEATGRRVLNVEETRFRDLVLSSRERGEPDAGAAARLLAEEILAGRLQLPLWNERAEQWVTRINRLAEWLPEYEFPPITEEDRALLIEQICHGCISFKQLKTREVFATLHQWLNPMQREMLDRLAPERVDYRPGQSAKVTYDAVNPPSISVVLQKLYDVNQNPRVAEGRVPVTVHLLSPAQRPIATTSDLARFWQEGYPLVKKDLKGRYPKHEWR